jgi:RecA/RadA recombinase
MALPNALAQLAPALMRAGVRLGLSEEQGQGLPLGVEGLDRLLPDHGLHRGGVVELAVKGPSGLLTSVALSAVRAVQGEAQGLGSGPMPWCAFVDPSSTLHAPGVEAAGVSLERLLVVRPSVEALSRVVIRLAESPAFSLVVVDTVGVPGRLLDVPLGTWARLARRVSMALDGTKRSVVLLTDAAVPRPLPLPVAQRIELERDGEEKLIVRVAKDFRGRVTPARSVVWTRRPPLLEALPVKAS